MIFYNLNFALREFAAVARLPLQFCANTKKPPIKYRWLCI